jgi:hypothetical protein
MIGASGGHKRWRNDYGSALPTYVKCELRDGGEQLRTGLVVQCVWGDWKVQHSWCLPKRGGWCSFHANIECDGVIQSKCVRSGGCATRTVVVEDGCSS